jgi:hypothetical protein
MKRKLCRSQCAALALAAAMACERGVAASLVSEAEFGIFFGGQVQERDEIPFELDRARQIQGIRLAFAKPLERDSIVRWELDMPGPERDAARVVRLGEAGVRAGQTRFEQVVPFSPGDRLGIWNVRVIVDNELVLDRSVVVSAADRRK